MHLISRAGGLELVPIACVLHGCCDCVHVQPPVQVPGKLLDLSYLVVNDPVVDWQVCPRVCVCVCVCV